MPSSLLNPATLQPGPPQAQLDPASAAGPGTGGAATAEGVAASAPPDAIPAQPATPAQPQTPAQPSQGVPTVQPMSLSWQPGITGSPLYPDGEGPVTSQVPPLSAMFSPGEPSPSTPQDISMSKLSNSGLVAPGFSKRACRTRKPYSKTVRGDKLRGGKWVPTHRFQGSRTARVKRAISDRAVGPGKLPTRPTDLPLGPSASSPLVETAATAAGAAALGGLLGAPVGAISGYRGGNTAEGLGRGVLRGGATGAGSAIGEVLGAALAKRLGGGSAPAIGLGRLLGAIGGGATGYFGSGLLLGPSGYSGKRVGRRGLTDAEEAELEKLERWQLHTREFDPEKAARLRMLHAKMLKHFGRRNRAIKQGSLERSAVGESGLKIRERPWSLQGSEAWPSNDWAKRPLSKSRRRRGQSKIAEAFIRRCRELGLDEVQTQAAMAKAASMDPRIAEDLYGVEKQAVNWTALRSLVPKATEWGGRAWRWARGAGKIAPKVAPKAEEAVSAARRGWRWLRGTKPLSAIKNEAQQTARGLGSGVRDWWRGYREVPEAAGVTKVYAGGRVPKPSVLYRRGALPTAARAGIGGFTGYQMGNVRDDTTLDNWTAAAMGAGLGAAGRRFRPGGAARTMMNRAAIGTAAGYGTGLLGQVTGWAGPDAKRRLAQIGGWGGLLSSPAGAFAKSRAGAGLARAAGGAWTGSSMAEVDSDSSWDNLLGGATGALLGARLPRFSPGVQTALRRAFTGEMGGGMAGLVGETLGLLPEGSAERLGQAGGWFGLASPALSRAAGRFSPELSQGIERGFREVMETPWENRVLKSFLGKGEATNLERAASFFTGKPAMAITLASPLASIAWIRMKPAIADATLKMVADALPYVRTDPKTGQIDVNLSKLLEEQPEVAAKVVEKGTEAFLKSDPDLAKVALTNGWFDESGNFDFAKFKQSLTQLAEAGSSIGGFAASPIGQLISGFLSLSPLQQLLMAGGLILGLGGLLRQSGTSSLMGLLMAGAGLLGPSLLDAFQTKPVGELQPVTSSPQQPVPEAAPQ